MTRACLGRLAAAALSLAVAAGKGVGTARAAPAETEPACDVPDGGAAPPQRVAERPLVLVFSPAHTGPLAGRLLAELAAVGMNVRPVVVAEDQTFTDLAPQVTVLGASGAIRILDGGFGAEVWIPDPATGRAALRQALSSETAQGTESVIIPRTVEFLRASLLPTAAPVPEVAPVKPPSPTLPPPDPALAAARVAAPPADPPRLRIAAAPAIVASPGGVGAFPSVALGLGVRIGRRAGVEASALLPLGSPRLETSQGAIRVAVTMAGAGAYLKLVDDRRWSAEVGAGGLAVWLNADGDAIGLNQGSLVRALGFAPYARAGATLALSPWLSARADVCGGALLERVVILRREITGLQQVATWGRPFATAMLGLQASWL